MSLQKIEPQNLVGKTIIKVDISGVNNMTLHFSDGTSLDMWAEIAISTPYGGIPGIFFEDGVDDLEER